MEHNQIEIQNKKSKVGRKPIQINYPTDNSAFTISQIISLNGGLIKRMTIQGRLNKEILAGTIIKAGKLELETKGRPEALYKKV